MVKVVLSVPSALAVAGPAVIPEPLTATLGLLLKEPDRVTWIDDVPNGTLLDLCHLEMERAQMGRRGGNSSRHHRSIPDSN